MKKVEWTIDSPPAEAKAYLDHQIWVRAANGRRFVADFARESLTEVDFSVERPFAGGFGFVRRGEMLEELELQDAKGNAVEVWTLLPDKRWFLPQASFSQGLCPVMTDEQRFGFLNTKGEMAIDAQYWLAEGFTGGYARVLPEGRREVRRGRLINLKGETKLYSKGMYLSGVHDGCCIELLDHRSIRVTFGLDGRSRGRIEIALKGNVYLSKEWQGEAMIPYRGKRPFSELDVGLVHLFQGEVGPMSWYEAASSCCGLSRVITDRSNHSVTFVNKNFESIRSMPWKEAQQFREGVCAVMSDHDRWSFIDIDGSPAFNGAFEETTAMHEGAALVRTGKGWGAINRAGCFLTESGEWDEVSAIGEQRDCFLARRGKARWVVLRASLRKGWTADKAQAV